MVTRSPRAAPDFQRLNQQPAPGLVGEAASQRAWEGQGYRPWEAVTKADLENLLANPQHTMWVGEADITADITSVEVPVWKIPEAYEITLLGTMAGTGSCGDEQTCTLIAAGYVSCVAADIGKMVQDDGVDAGLLAAYDNTTRVWRITSSATIAASSAMTVVAGVGAGTSETVPSVDTPVVVFPDITLVNIVQPRSLAFAVKLTAGTSTFTAPVPSGVLVPYTYTDFTDVGVGNYTIVTPPKIRFGIELKANQT